MTLQTKRPARPPANSILTTDSSGNVVYSTARPPSDIPSKAEIEQDIFNLQIDVAKRAKWSGLSPALNDSLVGIDTDGVMKPIPPTISDSKAIVSGVSRQTDDVELTSSDSIVVRDDSASKMTQVPIDRVADYVNGKISSGGLSHYIIRDATGTGNEKTITVNENAMVSGSMRNSASRINVARDVTYIEIDTLSYQTWRIVLPRGSASNTFTVSLTENSGCIFYRDSPTSNQWYAKGRGHCSKEYALSQVEATESVMGGDINQTGIYVQGIGYSDSAFYVRSNYISVTTSHTTKTRTQILLEPDLKVFLDLQKTSATANTFSFKPIIKPEITGETFRISYKRFLTSSAASTTSGIASGTEHAPLNYTLGSTVGYHDIIDFMVSPEKANSSFGIYHVVIKFSVVNTIAVRYDIVVTKFID